MIQAAGYRPFWQMAMHLAAALLALAITGVASVRAMDVKVRPDEARLVTLAGRPATVVVGNPLYTQVLVISGNKLLVQGRNPGKTNVIVLDAHGKQLAAFNVVVTGLQEEEIVLYEQGRRTTLMCAPECSQVANVDDTTGSWYSSRVHTRQSLIEDAMRQ